MQLCRLVKENNVNVKKLHVFLIIVQISMMMYCMLQFKLRNYESDLYSDLRTQELVT